MNIKYMKTTDLVPNSYNPNQHNAETIDLLLNSIKCFGFTQPIVIRAGTNEIIDGEHRWRCAAILNIEYVPVYELKLTDEQMKLATIIHNRARGQEIPDAIESLEREIGNYKDTVLNKARQKRVEKLKGI